MSQISLAYALKMKDLGTQRGPLNIIEPFVYKLLEILDLGVKVHFISSPHSPNVLYICGENVENFEEFGDLSKNW